MLRTVVEMRRRGIGSHGSVAWLVPSERAKRISQRECVCVNSEQGIAGRYGGERVMVFPPEICGFLGFGLGFAIEV